MQPQAPNPQAPTLGPNRFSGAQSGRWAFATDLSRYPVAETAVPSGRKARFASAKAPDKS